jgi:hypothetical protein
LLNRFPACCIIRPISRGFSVDPGRAFALLSTLQLAVDGLAAPPLVHPER